MCIRTLLENSNGKNEDIANAYRKSSLLPEYTTVSR